MSHPYAAGALVSSVDDLAKWDAALSTEKLVKQRTLQRTFHDFTLNDGEADKLIVKSSGQQLTEFLAESATRFFVARLDVEIEFVKDSAGNVSGLIFHQGDQRWQGKKTK